ncbi:MAG: flagellin [Planctomycetota bacterium]
MARINTNIAALTAQRNLTGAYRSLNTTMEHLSTGLRISRGKDDPAGLIVSERLRTEISAVGQAVSNTQRAKLIVATAEGALDEVASLLKDVQAKIVEAANKGAFSDEEIKANQLQIDSAIDSITRIANTTTFAGRKLLDGSLAYNTSGVELDAVRDLHVHAAQFGERAAIEVSVDVQTAAETGKLRFPFAGLAAPSAGGDVTIEIRGNGGATVLQFAGSTTAAKIVEAVQTVADATGVSASLHPTSGLVLVSRGYGSKQFVQVRALSGTFDTRDYDDVNVRKSKDFGTDAIATINGAVAAADGNHLSIKNSLIDLELDAHPNSAYSTTFMITGGGALFQVGPQVNTNLQVNMAINSVGAAELGLAEVGYLAQIRTGGDFALTNQDPRFNEASKIVGRAIDQISMLRGRLGSFERNTLDTNMNQLTITSENLMSAESAIRDADFAYETSRLARDQILVNAGTTILTLANQTTQSVLRLLGG